MIEQHVMNNSIHIVEYACFYIHAIYTNSNWINQCNDIIVITEVKKKKTKNMRVFLCKCKNLNSRRKF